MCEAQRRKEHMHFEWIKRYLGSEDSERGASKGRQGPDDKRSDMSSSGGWALLCG